MSKSNTFDVPQTPDEPQGTNRRGFLKCGLWAGTGVVWMMNGGVPRSMSLDFVDTALADAASFSFVQISDSHIGFNKAPNPDPVATFQQGLQRIKSLPTQPAFMIHTGDVSHLSKPDEFDTAEQIIKASGFETHYVPGEHDILVDDGKPFFERFSKSSNGWYSFDQNGVHFVALVNVLGFKSGGFGHLGEEQLAWLQSDLKAQSTSTPIVVFTHIPLWMVYDKWGWGTDDAAQAMTYLKPFGSVTILNGHIHQVMQKIEGAVSFHTAYSTAYPQPAPGTAPNPGPMKVDAGRLKSLLGIRDVNLLSSTQPLAIIDTPLSA
jgi:hypothetical protein